jgi:hypothetical protein
MECVGDTCMLSDNGWERVIKEMKVMKNKRKCSSYIRKYKGSGAKSSVVKYLHISSYIRKPFLILYMTMHLIPSEFPYIWGIFFSFLSVYCMYENPCLQGTFVKYTGRATGPILKSPWKETIATNKYRLSQSRICLHYSLQCLTICLTVLMETVVWFYSCILYVLGQRA